MKATIKAENGEYTYNITLTDDSFDNPNYVEMVIQQEGEDYYETWTVLVEDFSDMISIFENRRRRETN
jgi:hypothetical protein